MISTLENQIRDGPLAVPRCLPQQGWPGWTVPGSLLARGGVRSRISPRLCPRAGPSLGASPGSHPGSLGLPPPLSLGLGALSSDAFDAGTKAELVPCVIL